MFYHHSLYIQYHKYVHSDDLKLVTLFQLIECT